MSIGTHYQPLDAIVYPRYSGIRTFMRLPHVTDLSGVDFAIVAVPSDTGSAYCVGARFGPAFAISRCYCFMNLDWSFPHTIQAR